MAMSKSVKPKKSTGPPSRGSKWSAAWDEIVANYEPVNADSEDGWVEYICKDSRDAKRLQAALHQRSLRENADWRVQTQLDGKKIFFRRVWNEDTEDNE